MPGVEETPRTAKKPGDSKPEGKTHPKLQKQKNTRTIWNDLERFGTIWNHLEPFGTCTKEKQR